jgi:sulfite exporter TauE/SafE
MTYSMLLLAATTASAATGAAVMAAFGVGTLPSMVTATVAFEKIAGALSSRATLRNVAGVLLLAVGLWTAGRAVYHGLMHSGHAQNAPGEQPPAGHEHHH